MKPSPKSLRPVKGESIQVQVVASLRDAILSGRLRPGDPVPEVPLAREHGVSQTTVREALVKLEHAGLVRRVPNIGTFVTQMSPREIQEHLRLRVMLEGLAGMEAVRYLQPRHEQELDKRLESIRAAVARNDYYLTAQEDLEFHRYLWERSGDRTLCRMLDQLTVPLFAFVSMERRRLHEDLPSAVQAHEPIVAALKARAPAAVREAIREHIETSYAEFLGSASEERYVLSVG